MSLQLGAVAEAGEGRDAAVIANREKAATSSAPAQPAGFQLMKKEVGEAPIDCSYILVP